MGISAQGDQQEKAVHSQTQAVDTGLAQFNFLATTGRFRDFLSCLLDFLSLVDPGQILRILPNAQAGEQ